jgi:hypothetical protein
LHKKCEYLDISERFEKLVVPNWMKLGFELDFFTNLEGTDYVSDSMALLHYTDTPLTIVENKSCIKGKEQTIRFLRCQFESIDEAKRRALTLSLLTFNLFRQVFVPFYTDDTMNQPLILMNLRELWTTFKTHDWRKGDDRLEKTFKNQDELPEHTGLIISVEDQHLAGTCPYIKIRVKTQKGSIGEPEEIVEVEKDIVITSSKHEVNLLKQQAIMKEREMQDAQSTKMSMVKERLKEIGKKRDPVAISIVKSNAFGIDKVDISELTARVYSGRENKMLLPFQSDSQINRSQYTESKFATRKDGRIMPSFDDNYFKYTTTKERARDMNMIRIQMEEQKRTDITKVREINKLMKTMGKEEHQSNIKLFQKYNEDEKQIVKELIIKAKEKELNEKISRRIHMVKAGRKKELAKSDAKFALNFSKQKNLIEKYEHAGEKSKRIRNEKLEKLTKIQTLRAYKTNKPTVQLSSQVFDTSMVDEKFTKERK